MTTPLLGAIDIGSNTIHLLVARPHANGHCQFLDHQTDFAALGMHLTRTRHLSVPVINGIARTLRRQIKRAREGGVAAIVIGATEVMRRAPYGKQILEQLARDIDNPIHLLSAHREAQLGFLGARPYLHPKDPELLIDCGGGSTEITLSQRRRPVTWASLPIGSGILSAGLHHDPPQPLEWFKCVVPIQKAMWKAPRAPHPKRAIAIGGSAHFLAKLVHGKREGVLTDADLDQASAILLNHASKTVAKKRGMRPERVRVMPAGLLIMSQVLHFYGLSRMKVTRAGIREGMLQAYLDKGVDWWKED